MSNKSNNHLPSGSVKFREHSADSVVFLLEDHTAEQPRTLTLTRTLPVARKGNAGATKILTNVHINTNIGTDEAPKIVPVVAKLEVSAPVGASSAAIQCAILNATSQLSAENSVYLDSHPLSQQVFDSLYKQGILPEGQGEGSSESFTLDSVDQALNPPVFGQ
jgi:hypothetical protein